VKTVARLFLLMTVVTMVELFLLMRLGQATSWWVSVAMIVIPGLLGAWLARREGAKAFGAIREAMSLQREPAGAILDGVIVLVAAVLLITPGVLTDVTGLALLLPPVRKVVREYARRRLHTALDRRIGSASIRMGGYEVIDADDIPKP
jgi:UPF0716 protein FxsA